MTANLLWGLVRLELLQVRVLDDVCVSAVPTRQRTAAGHGRGRQGTQASDTRLRQ